MFCDRCGASLRAGGPVPACPEHGPRWLLARNAPASEVLVEREGRVLLGRRAVEPHRGCWEVPGGFADRGEHPAETARRELHEELGVDVVLTGVLGIYLDTYLDDIVQVTTFTGRTEDEPVPNREEMLECAWFAPGAWPHGDDLAPWHHERLDDWERVRRGEPARGLQLG